MVMHTREFKSAERTETATLTSLQLCFFSAFIVSIRNEVVREMV